MKLLSILLLTFLSGNAAAASSGWYGKPQANVRAIQANDLTVIQGTAGVEAGLRYGLTDTIKGRTRAGLAAVYGFNSGSIGGDVRIGSFIGPSGKSGFIMFGPDLWLNGYGKNNSPDYRLNWSPGISLPTTASLDLSSALRLIGGVTPGWAFAPQRKLGGWGPFDELGLLGAGVVSAGSGYLTIGYQHTWNNIGVIRGIILSGSL